MFVTKAGTPVVVKFMMSDGVNVTTSVVASSSTKDRYLKKLIFYIGKI